MLAKKGINEMEKTSHLKSPLLISATDQKHVLSGRYSDAIHVIEEAFRKNRRGEFLLPDKISIIFDEEKQNRINCMPSALLSDKLYGMKWISVFPDNPQKGLKNVTGTIVISELDCGQLLAIMDAGFLTEIRTAAVGALAAKYLSREDSTTIGFIGAGQQARRHLDLLKLARPGLKTCYVSSRTESSVLSFIEEESVLHPDIDFVSCGNDFSKATCNADIVVTAISGQEAVLKAKWIKRGTLYIHVAGWEDEYAVALMANKIVCDNWENVKHRTQTISRMYKEKIIDDSNIYGNLDEIICSEKNGRESNNEFIYFCSVGLAYIDISLAKYFYEQCLKEKIGFYYSFL